MIKSSNRLSFLGFQNHWRWGLYHEITRHLLLGRKAMYDKPKQHIKKQRCYFATKVHQVKAMVFPIIMYGCELHHKESWAWKNWCLWIVVLEKTLESPLDCKEIQPVNLKGNQSWISIGRTDAETETLILWRPDVKNWLIGKDPDAGKDLRCEEKGMTEDEMVGWCGELPVRTGSFVRRTQLWELPQSLRVCLQT